MKEFEKGVEKMLKVFVEFVEFRQFLRSVGKSIGIIAIDESHCIVKW